MISSIEAESRQAGFIEQLSEQICNCPVFYIIYRTIKDK